MHALRHAHQHVWQARKIGPFDPLALGVGEQRVPVLNCPDAVAAQLQAVGAEAQPVVSCSVMQTMSVSSFTAVTTPCCSAE